MVSYINGLTLRALPFLDEMRAVTGRRQQTGLARFSGSRASMGRAGGNEFLAGYQSGRHAEESRFMAATKTSPKTAVATRAANSKVKSAKAADQRFQQAKRASILLKHVSDPTRLQVILILSEGERHVGALCAQLSQSQPAVSHHLALLRHGNIIAPRRQGKNNFYSLTDTGSELARVVKHLIA
jgi:DNA-binding transcriptional ArsR family regulator